MTPHINAPADAFSKTVLMPGDPLRAKYIAETYLESPEMVTNVRNMYGYTGIYKGKKISVMGHGMGIPSCSIYVKELITEYGVENIIRVGSCGAVRDDVHVRDVVIAMSASTDSKVNRNRFQGHDFAATANYDVLSALVESAKSHSVDHKVGVFFTEDLFYNPNPTIHQTLKKYGIIAVEMETAGIFGVAAEYGAKAGSICTVSDHILNKEHTTSEEREKTFNDMMLIALDAGYALTE